MMRTRRERENGNRARHSAATECDSIDRAGMDAETNDPARVLIHNLQDPLGPQGYRLSGTDLYSRGFISCGPRKSARTGQRRPLPASSDGEKARIPFEPRLCRLQA